MGRSGDGKRGYFLFHSAGEITVICPSVDDGYKGFVARNSKKRGGT